MAFTNNIMIVRHRLLTELVKLWRDNELVEKIDRLPIELSPRRSKHAGRCCVHKERAVWKYKSLPLLGLDMEDEKDELTPLSEYAVHALDRAENGTPKDNIMCVIDEACSACVQINYEITNLCRGCTARSCQTNCPKKAVHVKESGQAWIDHDECISCGICHKSCPYHAIVYIPVPCEEACPVKAISKDKKGIEHIDESKCIYCGKCLNACPFGAIFEVSQVFDILHKIRKGEKIVAIVAPSILGQFKTTIEQVYGALKAVGFTDVIEVAQGAMDTVSNEAHELIEKLEGLGFIKGEQLLESDTYFTSENHDFVKLGEALRVRQIRNVDTDETSAVITYKGKKLDDRSMAREELELEIPDAEVGKTLLQRIGFYSVPVLEKKRWYFRRNEMTACVDQVTGLGDYLELEIIVETEAEREGALQRIENVLVSLGYSMKDTTRHSYLSMLTNQTRAMEVAHEHYI